MNPVRAARNNLRIVPQFASSLMALSLSASVSFAADTTWSGTTKLDSPFEVGAGDVLSLVPQTDPSQNLNLTIGSEPSATGELTVSGGWVKLDGTAGKDMGIFLGDGGTGILNVSSGTISYHGPGGTNRLWVGMAAGGWLRSTKVVD
jgi:hypothetical protein